MDGEVFLLMMWGLSLTFFWMVVGWRAMRAFENVADSLERVAEAMPGNKVLER